MSTSPLPPQPPPPAETVFSNDDLLTEILSHIPVKPLLKFKSVNKQFQSVISHPQFSLLHTLRHIRRPPSGLFFRHHDASLSPLYQFISFTSSPFSSVFKSHILQSCNGLLLCSFESTVFICNPVTNRISSLDIPKGDGKISWRLALGFDPAISAHYKIVSVSASDIGENSYSIDVYSSETRKWRVGVVDPFDVAVPFDVEFDRGVYCENRVYWLSHTETTIFFDLETECVESLSLPKAIEGAYMERFRYMGECCGHLHLVEIRTNCVHEFHVLELDRKSNRGWLSKYRVNLDVLGRGFETHMFLDHSDRFGRGLRFYAFSILAVVRENVGEDEDDSALVISIPGKLISYNFRTEVSKLLCNVGDETDKLFPFRGYNAFQFIPSLYCF